MKLIKIIYDLADRIDIWFTKHWNIRAKQRALEAKMDHFPDKKIESAITEALSENYRSDIIIDSSLFQKRDELIDYLKQVPYHKQLRTTQWQELKDIEKVLANNNNRDETAEIKVEEIDPEALNVATANNEPKPARVSNKE